MLRLPAPLRERLRRPVAKIVSDPSPSLMLICCSLFLSDHAPGPLPQRANFWLPQDPRGPARTTPRGDLQARRACEHVGVVPRWWRTGDGFLLFLNFVSRKFEGRFWVFANENGGKKKLEMGTLWSGQKWELLDPNQPTTPCAQDWNTKETKMRRGKSHWLFEERQTLAVRSQRESASMHTNRRCPIICNTFW